MNIQPLCTLWAFGLFSGCTDKEAEAVYNCFSESLFLDVRHKASAENTKMINDDVIYRGSMTLRKQSGGTLVTELRRSLFPPLQQ